MTQNGAPASGNERILVVDDEPDIVALVVYHLAKAGFRISTASNGPDALRIARQDRPALVVLDLMLPGMSGMEVLEELRAEESGQDIAVLLLDRASRRTGSHQGALVMRRRLFDQAVLSAGLVPGVGTSCAECADQSGSQCRAVDRVSTREIRT